MINFIIYPQKGYSVYNYKKRRQNVFKAIKTILDKT